MRKRIRKLRKAGRDLVPVAAEKAVSIASPKAEEPLSLENVPRITNETIAVHREEVLKGARKYIYPLQHSKHRIVVITSAIIAATIISFLVYCTLALYKGYQYNTFIYRVTQVVPFPIARTGKTFVAYENYLFELRHYVHYYQTQLQRNLNGPDDRQQLLAYRKQALNQVIDDAYVKILAHQNGVKVTDKEVTARINEVRNQNRLGSNDKVFAEVLKDYWGWSIADFKRSLKQQILEEKVVAKLDTATTKRAQSALAKLRAGADFTAVAKKVSDDTASKGRGGDYGFTISETNPNVPPEVVQVLFNMKSGQVSDIILASSIRDGGGPTLEIVKLIKRNGNSLTAQHITFNLQDISHYIDPLKKQQPVRTYVHF